MNPNKLLIIIFWLCITPCVQGQNLSRQFTAQEIPDSVWNKMQGKTYHPNPHIQRSDLRYLKVLHWDYDEKTHQGELICNKLIADKLLAIFRELYAGHYPIQKMRLPDEYDADDERQQHQLLLLPQDFWQQQALPSCSGPCHRHQHTLQSLCPH